MNEAITPKPAEKKNLQNLFGESRLVGNDLNKNGNRQQVKLSVKDKLRKFFSKETVLNLQENGKVAMSLMSFFGLVLIFLFELLFKTIGKLPGLKQILNAWVAKTGHRASHFSEKLIMRFEAKPGRIRRSVLINLAFRNMRVKRTRAFVTVGRIS